MSDGDFPELVAPGHGPVTPGNIPVATGHSSHDRHNALLWLWEPPVVAADGVLTEDGVTQIAHHKYKAGSSTALDLALDSTWQRLTDMLPLSMAPNMVTTLGGLHCLLAYVVTWHYSPHFGSDVPNWVLLLNAYCSAAYYTLDCMDGKQARRTGTSSPLGQLFDHGVDCVCLQQNLSMCMAWLALPGSRWVWAAQAGLQISFFMAQWEEYYTGVLPHATGNVGVTEVNYGLALACLVIAFIPNRAALYSLPIAEILPPYVLDTISPMLAWAGKDNKSFQLKHACVTGWYIMCATLCILCLIRVLSSQIKANRSALAALSKLLSPALLCLTPFVVELDVLRHDTRWFSLAFGLALTQITIKLIVFSMARQAFAAIQQIEVLPLTLAMLWIRCDERWKRPGVRLLLQALTVIYFLRIIHWTAASSRQICGRLDIYLFTIKPKTKEV